MDKPRPRTFLWMFPIMLLFALAIFAIGVFMARRDPGNYAILAAGCASVFAILAVWALALNLTTARQSSEEQLDELIGPVNERLQQISVLLNMVSEQQLISDRAKAVAFRDNERDTIRRAIQEEIAKKDYEAALALAADMETAFGYKQEADRFREEIGLLRQGEMRKVVNDTVAIIDRHCRAEQWSQALREAERLLGQFPNDAQIRHLPQEIETRRQATKQRLLDSWNTAVARHDVDGSIEIIRQLDAYLTPAEADSMQEAARRVFKDKLQLLGQQFTLAVRDHNWGEAVRIGEAVMHDFPNSLMAKEVAEKIVLLRQKALAPQAAPV